MFGKNRKTAAVFLLKNYSSSRTLLHATQLVSQGNTWHSQRIRLASSTAPLASVPKTFPSLSLSSVLPQTVPDHRSSFTSVFAAIKTHAVHQLDVPCRLKNVFIQNSRPDSLSFQTTGFLLSLFLPPRNLVFSARDGHRVARLHLTVTNSLSSSSLTPRQRFLLLSRL